MHIPRGYAVNLAAAVKGVVSIPVFAAGRILDAEQAGRILADGQADGVEMIRALIADPHLPRLSQAGQAALVRPCIACNQGCQVRNVMNAALSCNANPDVMGNDAVGTRFSASSSPTRSSLEAELETGGTTGPPGRDSSRPYEGGVSGHDKPRPYVVIGGGPAGMEAARTLAMRGRRVALYERGAALGGAVALAAKAPGRGELRLITEYLQRQLELLGVEVHLGVEVTAEMILAEGPEAAIVATGAKAGAGLLPIPGCDLPHVSDMRRILRGEQITGQRVVVIDETDSHGALSVAEMLATQGKRVEIITEDWYVGRDLVATHDLVPWMQRVLAMDVVMTPHTSIARIEPGQVIVTDRFAAGERAIEADAVVLGTYERPAQELYFALKGRVPRLFRAGDCVAPRRIEQAVLEGRQAGLQC
jgi:thioredoxin reductase